MPNLRLPAIRQTLLERVQYVKLFMGSLRTYDLEGYAELASAAMNAFEMLCQQLDTNQEARIQPFSHTMRAGSVAITETGNVCIIVAAHKNMNIAAQEILRNLNEQFALYPAGNVWYVVPNGEKPFTLPTS